MKLTEIYLIVKILEDGERVPIRAYFDKTFADTDIQMLKEAGEPHYVNYTIVPVEFFDGILETQQLKSEL